MSGLPLNPLKGTSYCIYILLLLTSLFVIRPSLEMSPPLRRNGMYISS